jgi:hypothetical protein
LLCLGFFLAKSSFSNLFPSLTAVILFLVFLWFFCCVLGYKQCSRARPKWHPYWEVTSLLWWMKVLIPSKPFPPLPCQGFHFWKLPPFTKAKVKLHAPQLH